jgi:hypothetical protein
MDKYKHSLRRKDPKVYLTHFEFLEDPTNNSFIGMKSFDLEITYEEMAKYFGPEDYDTWTKEKRDGFIEAVTILHLLDCTTEFVSGDRKFSQWVFDNIYRKGGK